MDEMRAKYGTKPDGWFQTHREIVDWVRAELAERGPLRPAQIEHDAKKAARGPVVGLGRRQERPRVPVAVRRGRDRRAARASSAATAWPSTCCRPTCSPLRSPATDAIRELDRTRGKAHGVGTASDLADYWRIKDRRAVMTAIGELRGLGRAAAGHGAGLDSRAGRPAKAWVHRDAALPRRVDAAAILTPFDPVVWFRDRAERLFDFEYRIEIYTPAPQRRFGYYSLPVLIGDDIVGRVDLKADRRTSTLLVQSAWWEHGRPADAAARLADELRAAARWQGLESDLGVAVGRCHRRPRGRAARGTRHEAGTAEAVALAPDEPEPQNRSALA